MNVEEHGDDFLVDGPRDQVLALGPLFQEAFLVKKMNLVSMHPEDEKEAWYLHRKYSVDEEGWHEEIDPRYGETLVKQQGLEMGQVSKDQGFKSTAETRITPSSNKSKAETPINNKLNKHDHTSFKGGAGMA